jgi:small subunit ribosomal protein S1
VNEQDDFAAMFEASLKAKRFERGQSLEGTIVGIGPEVVFVDVGGKGEATIDIDEVKDADGRIEVKVGERIQAVVTSTSGGITLSRKLARRAATDRQLEDAFHSGLPVEGRVERAVKGGYEVRIGSHRAFCPMSQIDLARAEASTHEGQVYTFRIVEYGEGGRNLVVSRRAFLEAEQRAAGDEVRKSLVPGAVVKGRVASVRDFGAFVDLGGGVQGLLHVSEMGWSRVYNPADVVKPGDEITVQVLRLDEDKQKISLGLKQLLADPWATIQDRYKTGDLRTGRVTRLAEFGAFVELEPGIEGLVPISETGIPRDTNLARVLPVGTEVQVIVLDVDAASRRMRLSTRAVAGAREADEVREYRERPDTQPPDKFGSLADKLRGALDPKDR